MESEFEPPIRTEETSKSRIVIYDCPGFKKEDLKVLIDYRGNIVLRGERRVNEMEETTKVGRRLEKIHRGRHRFRKVLDVPENLNFDGIIFTVRDERVDITLPFLHISDQQNQDAIPASGKPDQPVQSKAQSSNPAGHQDSMKERSGFAQDDQRARHPEASRQDDGKAKGSATAEESKRLVEERKTEAPKLAQDFVHGEPAISKDAIQERSGDQSARHPDVIRPDDHKAKPIAAAGESNELVEGEKVEEPKHAQDFVAAGAPISKDPMQERYAVAQGDQKARHPEAIRRDDDKSKPNAAAEESKELVGGEKEEVCKHARDFVGAGAQISKEAMQEQSAVAQNEQRRTHPEVNQPDDYKETASAAAEESKGSLEEKKAEAPKRAEDFVHGEPAISTHAHAASAQVVSEGDQYQLIQSKFKQDEEKREQELKADDDEEANDEEDDEEEDEDEDEDEELSSPSDEFPETVIRIPSSSGLSVFSKEKVFIASALLVLCVGLYLS